MTGEGTDKALLAWLEWLRGSKHVQKSRRKPLAHQLLAVASEHDIAVPAEELERVRRLRAFDVSNHRTLLDTTTDFDSPATTADDIVLRSTGSFGAPDRGDDDDGMFGMFEGDFRLRAGRSKLRGLAVSYLGNVPTPIATQNVAGGWGWLVLADLGGEQPEGWLLPLGLTVVDVVLLHASGLPFLLFRADNEYAFEQIAKSIRTLEGKERNFIEFCIARLRRAAEVWGGEKGVKVRGGRSLADGCQHVMTCLDRLEKAEFVEPEAPSAAVWPDTDLHEDELAAEIVDAYSAEEWSPKQLRRLLKRGGRHRTPKKRSWAKGTPRLLRVFVEERAAGHGVEPGDGHPSIETDLYSVFHVGNGDGWVCDPDGNAYYWSHEDYFDRTEPVPLGVLLAAWLFHDEVVSRGLEEHPDIEAHASDMLEIAASSVFAQIDVT